MAEKHKKDIRDRNDAWYLKDIDSMHVIMPYVMPHRSANEAVVGEIIDIEKLDAYVKAKNADGPDFKYTWFHVICAALAKSMILRPKMNWFITGHRMYEKKELDLGFTIKRKFEDKSEEALAKVKIDKDGGPIIDQVYTKVRDYVTAVRVHDETKGITNQFNFFQVLPRPIFKFFVWILRVMDYFGCYPEGLKKDDPCYCSVYVTNLGSIKLNADYHHLFEWGTNSFFVVIGEKKLRPFFHDDGTYEMRNTIKLSLTIDERIADGYYFSKTLKLLKHILQNPELLDLPASAPVEYEF